MEEFSSSSKSQQSLKKSESPLFQLEGLSDPNPILPIQNQTQTTSIF